MVFKWAAVFLSLLPLAACAIPDPPAFYDTPVPNAAPGSLVSAEPFAPVPGATAYRVLYVSTDSFGAKIPVSGIVYVPTAPPPPGGRNLVAWAHATTGIAPGCAPSLDSGPDMAASVPGLSDFLSAGDIVAATDYQGMGVAGVHPYLIGRSEGAAILDSVRAGVAPGRRRRGRPGNGSERRADRAFFQQRRPAAGGLRVLHLVQNL